jgi:cysteine synthase A
MLADALRSGRLEPGGTVVESSSGNMGVGLAQACRYHGLDFICVTDSRTCPEKIASMRAFGAEVRVVEEPDPEIGDLLETRIATVSSLIREIPGSFWPDQYTNEANPGSHADGTMSEILEALGDVDAMVVATSTAGTLAGCERRLRLADSEAELVAVDAEGSALFGGSRHPRLLPGIGAGIETDISRRVRPDRLIRVGAAGSVIGCRRLVEREAILAGASTGAVMTAVGELAAERGPEARVAAIAADGGADYLSTVYDDGWVQRELDLAPADLRRAIDIDRDAGRP